MNEELIAEAEKYWQAGQGLEAGRLLFEALPQSRRPGWGAEVLALVTQYVPSVPEIATVLEIANDKDRWDEARDAFSAVRALTLQAEKQRGAPPVYEGMLMLAENVAKITHNAISLTLSDVITAIYSQIDPAYSWTGFDKETGWWIASNLLFIANHLDDPEFGIKAWRTLIAPYCSAS